jgi:hypothetical protein
MAMSLLADFKPFNFSEGVPQFSVTRNGVTFNKAVVKKMDYPSHAVLLLNENDKQLAVQGCNPNTPNAVEFYKEKKSGVISVRWNSKDLLNNLQYMMQWDLKMTGYRVEGVVLKDEKAVLFDLTAAVKLI